VRVGRHRRSHSGESVTLWTARLCAYRREGGTETLAEHVEEWWRTYARPNLAVRTLGVYASEWDLHVEPYLGHMRLRDIDVRVVQSWLADLAEAGVGLPTRKRTLALLSGVLQRAVEWQRIPSNQARLAKLPPVRRQREVPSMPPRVVEAIRAQLGARDAALVSVLAYAGPRPSEALARRWRDVGKSTLLMHATKRTSRRLRSTPLLAPLRADLTEWRLASGRPGEDALVFPRRDGKQWTDGDLRNWRNRVYKPAARAAGLTGAVTTLRPAPRDHLALAARRPQPGRSRRVGR